MIDEYMVLNEGRPVKIRRCPATVMSLDKARHLALVIECTSPSRKGRHRKCQIYVSRHPAVFFYLAILLGSLFSLPTNAALCQFVTAVQNRRGFILMLG